MEQPEMRSFEDFWPFYVRAHQNETNRTLHFVGTTLAMGSIAAAALARRPAFLLAAPVLGYGFAWVGHLLVEGNKPATWGHPLWSLRGDMIMWWKTATGTMNAEVARVVGSNGVQAEAAKAASAEAEAN
jgi:hypothetical protein